MSEAKGEYIIVADSDNTYDFLETPKFLSPLTNEGYVFVTGSRFKGKIVPGAMPWLHKYIGNPYLWLTANIEFALKRDDLRDDIIKFIKNLNL